MHHLSWSASTRILNVSKGNIGVIEREREEREQREQRVKENDEFSKRSGGKVDKGRDNVDGHGQPDDDDEAESGRGVVWSSNELESLQNAFEQSCLGRGRGKPPGIIEVGPPPNL